MLTGITALLRGSQEQERKTRQGCARPKGPRWRVPSDRTCPLGCTQPSLGHRLGQSPAQAAPLA